MTVTPSLAREVASNAPLPFMGALLSFVNTYGALVLFALSIAYAVFQFYWRRKEHRKIMGA